MSRPWWLGVLVLLVVFAVQLTAARSAHADVTLDIQQAAQDVANGTASPAETELYQGFVDWEESNMGVASGNVTFPQISSPSGDVAWQQDPDLEAIQQAQDATISAGSEEAAVGGEMITGGSEMGLIESVGSAVAESPLGQVCLTQFECVAAAGGVVLAIELGSKIANLFDDGVPISDVTDGSTNGTASPVAEAKIWLEPQGACTTGGGTSWQLYSWWDHWNGQWDWPPMAFQGGNLGSGWSGGGQDTRADFGRWVPCGTPDPGGGLWFLDMNFQTPGTQLGWTVVDQSAWDETSPVTMGWMNATGPCPNTIGNDVWWSPPLPGYGAHSGKPWYRETWVDNANLPNCGQANQQGIVSALYMTEDTEVAYERGTGAHIGFPRTGTCNSSNYPDGCLPISPNPAGSWCVTASCVANLFASSNYSKLEQFVNSAIGTAAHPASSPSLTAQG